MLIPLSLSSMASAGQEPTHAAHLKHNNSFHAGIILGAMLYFLINSIGSGVKDK